MEDIFKVAAKRHGRSIVTGKMQISKQKNKSHMHYTNKNDSNN